MKPSSDDFLKRRALHRLGTSLCGRYTILQLIGLGGMAAVYAAVHRNGHAVAIKILHEGLAADPEVERLFRREAQLANKVGHPGVVPVIDDDVSEDGCVFLVMPLLEGETLRARAERLGGKLPASEVVVAAHAVLRALAAAHAKKIVHRDIKPENIFVTCGGDVLVLDFGIGRFFDTDAASATRSGRSVGTPAFMAPEQALGRMREVDGRTDLWALGATMFSLFSGRFVHDGEGAGELSVLAATKPPRALADVAPDVEPGIGAVVDRALSFGKEGRWPDAEEMDQALLTAVGEFSSLPPISAPLTARFEEVDTALTHPPQLAPDAINESPDESRTPTKRQSSSTRRTTRGAVVASAGVRARPFARRAIILGGVAVTALLLAVPFAMSRLRKPSTVTASAPGTALGGGSPSVAARETFLSGALNLAGVSGSSLPETALRDYQVGLRLWLDGSPYDALAKFDSATAAAPDFAVAHLWFVIAAATVDTPVRQHHASAVLYRDTLNEGQHRMLDALGPSIGDPPDLRGSEARVAQLANDSHDPIAPLVLARIYLRQGKIPEGLAALDQLETYHVEPPTLALYIRASLSAIDNDVPSVRFALRACAERSPPGQECLAELWWLEANEGNCEELEPLCRRMLSNDPESVDAYSCFVDALSATGATPDALRAAYAEQETRTPVTRVASARAENTTRLAVLEGRLADAAQSARDWQATLSSPDRGTFVRLVAYEFRIKLDMELQRDAEARRALHDMEGQSRSWPRNTSASVEGTTVYLRSLVGTISANERDSERADLSVAFRDSAFMSPTARWYALYARTAWSAAEARTAIEQMPLRPLFAPQYRDAENDYRIGQIFALAGEREKAKAFLRRASRSCSAKTDLARTEAKVALAQLSEETPEACLLYSSVVHHWSATPGSKAVTIAVARARALRCPDIN